MAREISEMTDARMRWLAEAVAAVLPEASRDEARRLRRVLDNVGWMGARKWKKDFDPNKKGQGLVMAQSQYADVAIDLVSTLADAGLLTVSYEQAVGLRYVDSRPECIPGEGPQFPAEQVPLGIFDLSRLMFREEFLRLHSRGWLKLDLASLLELDNVIYEWPMDYWTVDRHEVNEELAYGHFSNAEEREMLLAFAARHQVKLSKKARTNTKTLDELLDEPITFPKGIDHVKHICPVLEVDGKTGAEARFDLELTGDEGGYRIAACPHCQVSVRSLR